MARSGYTLPVFAVAAAKAALSHLLASPHRPDASVEVNLMPEVVEIPIEQVAELGEGAALAIARSDPGDNLDLTRNTPIWAYVQLVDRQQDALQLEAGEGLGRTAAGKPAIYRYARELFRANVEPSVPEGVTARVRIVLPQGRQLAQRTSNEAFGVLEGLALLGTSGISQPLAASESLEGFRDRLRQAAQQHDHLVFCLGSNGQRVATRLGIEGDRIVQTANWIGAMLVEAALLQVESVLLIGYHGKLLKLAGGIFHTSSHVADAKLEILAAAAVRVGVPMGEIEQILAAATAEEARSHLVRAGWSETVFGSLAERITQNAQAYARKYADRTPAIGTILFDRQGQIVSRDRAADEELNCWRKS
ncbi:cobalt-precorrin-5B (C(1))-methyltransferase CbiD [Synechococcus sp. PCC 7336]|uniref:cobalt-precorrin-5B (C(1))-methyltransferase CbiD n=1 Tax=Synechococcus sp. PCC 7336 TaxID=195250 RepID=UPI0003491246